MCTCMRMCVAYHINVPASSKRERFGDIHALVSRKCHQLTRAAWPSPLPVVTLFFSCPRERLCDEHVMYALQKQRPNARVHFIFFSVDGLPASERSTIETRAGGRTSLDAHVEMRRGTCAFVSPAHSECEENTCDIHTYASPPGFMTPPPPWPSRRPSEGSGGPIAMRERKKEEKKKSRPGYRMYLL